MSNGPGPTNSASIGCAPDAFFSSRRGLLVFTWLPDWQGDATESLVRFDLEEANGVTTVRLTHSGLVSETSRESHKGWPQILAWLRAYVEG